MARARLDLHLNNTVAFGCLDSLALTLVCTQFGSRWHNHQRKTSGLWVCCEGKWPATLRWVATSSTDASIWSSSSSNVGVTLVPVLAGTVLNAAWCAGSLNAPACWRRWSIAIDSEDFAWWPLPQMQHAHKQPVIRCCLGDSSECDSHLLHAHLLADIWTKQTHPNALVATFRLCAYAAYQGRTKRWNTQAQLVRCNYQETEQVQFCPGAQTPYPLMMIPGSMWIMRADPADFLKKRKLKSDSGDDDEDENEIKDNIWWTWGVPDECSRTNDILRIELGFACFYAVEILLKLAWSLFKGVHFFPAKLRLLLLKSEAVHRALGARWFTSRIHSWAGPVFSVGASISFWGLYFFINDDMRWNIFDMGLVLSFEITHGVQWQTGTSKRMQKAHRSIEVTNRHQSQIDIAGQCCQVIFSGVEITSSFIMLSEGVAREAWETGFDTKSMGRGCTKRRFGSVMFCTTLAWKI